MVTPILQTKLYIPPPRPDAIPRPHLIERLDAGRQRKLTLVAAPAGFGKTTLVSVWLSEIRDWRVGQTTQSPAPNLQSFEVAWLSLDEADSPPARFLTYLIAALQTIAPGLGGGVQAMLQSPQPPPTEALLTPLLNEIITLPHPVILVLDDYHVVDSRAVDEALTFVINHQPPNLHLVIATREDPPLPLARLRARGHLTELRAADLRFTPDEAAAFLNEAMGLSLSAGDVAALERRTEGWIAGLHLAALKPLLAESKAGRRHDVRLGARVLAALAHQAVGDKDEAVQYLAQALALAEPGGAIRLFVDEGPLLMQLLREVATCGLAPNYTRTLLAAFDVEVRRRREAAPPLATGALIEPLTARERDVLKLMAAGRSNPEIAAQLVIAVTTVKTHVKNIFGKLHAANRVEAVARARDLNLL